MNPVKLIIVGAGDRGTTYTNYAFEYPDLAKVVGVAEPRQYYRDRMAQKHNISAENVYTNWKEIVSKSKFTDAVIIATQDFLHTEPAIAFLNKGYNVLLEKPMAQNEKDCRRITQAALENNNIFAVCHVLRYTGYTQQLKAIIDSGAIGEIVSVQHLEPVGYWHQAHSFVRGNWRNENQSSPMLLSKSCHDLDWIRYIIGCRCIRISSFGNLKHFRKENKPRGAGSRCLNCSYESQCPYSARKIYLMRAERGDFDWPVNVITTELTVEGVTESLRNGQYGRCVYECDNDVVDNQVVNMLFENGCTSSFTMTAFTELADRKTRIFGTLGYLEGNGNIIEHLDFLTDKTNVIQTGDSDGSILSGHGGGDYELMKSFVASIANNNPEKILSGPVETLETHLMVFAAEEARRKNCVVDL